MMLFIIVIHVISCLMLIAIVLIQQGRGGGLVESFSKVESMFGPKTSAFFTKATTVLSTIFFTTCLTLAIFSARQSRSLMKNVKPEAPKTEATAQQTAPIQAQPAK